MLFLGLHLYVSHLVGGHCGGHLRLHTASVSWYRGLYDTNEIFVVKNFLHIFCRTLLKMDSWSQPLRPWGQLRSQNIFWIYVFFFDCRYHYKNDLNLCYLLINFLGISSMEQCYLKVPRPDNWSSILPWSTGLWQTRLLNDPLEILGLNTRFARWKSILARKLRSGNYPE